MWGDVITRPDVPYFLDYKLHVFHSLVGSATESGEVCVSKNMG